MPTGINQRGKNRDGPLNNSNGVAHRTNLKSAFIPNRRAIQAVFYGNPDKYPPIINSTRLLDKAQFNVQILCRDNGERWDVSYPTTADVKRIATNSKSSWKAYLRFVVAVVKAGDHSASAFVGHDAHGLLPAWLLARIFRRPLVYHCHDYIDSNASILTIGLKLVSKFQQRFAKTADLVIVPDAERARIMCRELHLKDAPLIVANAPLSRLANSGDALRSALASQNRYYDRILFRQGSIGPGHGIESTLQSMPQWASRKWGFVVMGLSESSYRDKLAHQARDLGIEGQFVVLPPVPYDQVAHFTYGAHCGHALYQPVNINHTYYTTASNKIMEYMEAGLPLLVSSTPSVSELIKKHKCGVTANQNSPESIAAAVNALLGNPQESHEMGASARRAFEQEFCYEKQFAPVMRAIERLSNRHPKSM
jgi:glycosyltransferase involved in cell wall biosynthesis